METELYAFDLDGTLIEGHVSRPDPKGPFVQELDFLDVRWLDGRLDALVDLIERGKKIAVCTNKAGVAFGHATLEDCKEKCDTVIGDLLHHAVDRGLEWRGEGLHWYEAYGHPDASLEPFRQDDPDRKPRPGMLLRAMARAGAEPRSTIFVGDMDADKEAAERAGCSFCWADEFFSEGSRR